MGIFEQAHAAAKQRRVRVVFPELTDPRVAEATRRIGADGVAEVVALADPSEALVAAMQGVRPIKDGLADRLLTRPLYRAAAMVSAGQADVMVAGVTHPTRRVIEAAAMAIGLAEDCATPSSFFLMSLPGGRDLIFADCALNVDPDAAQLADIARASARSAKALLGRADVALLSYSTGASGAGASVDKVREVAELTGFAGPMQADAALNAAIADKKGVAAGHANTLIFPDLNAGNIAYKLMQELAGAQAIGPLLQGFRHPVCDLSRGANVDDIVKATVLTIALTDPA